jgi:hypothetical protein
MDIVAVLKEEELKLQKKLSGIRSALSALVDGHSNGAPAAKRVLSPAAKARISRAAKARWAKFRAEKKNSKGGVRAK